MRNMKHKLLTCILIFIAITCCNQKSICQNKVQIGKSIVFDGIIENKEWDDASIFTFKQNEFLNAKVFIKHDNQNLLILYLYNNQKDSTYYLPEFFIDTKLNKSKTWEEDDYWFHVSAQDCYSIGKREDYSKCSTADQIWKATPNYPFGNEFKKIDAFEISVPFELLNIKSGQRIGICFSIAIYPEEMRLNYPNNSNEDIPETWLELTII